MSSLKRRRSPSPDVDHGGSKRQRNEKPSSSSSSKDTKDVPMLENKSEQPLHDFEPMSLASQELSLYDPKCMIDASLAKDLGIYCAICLSLPAQPTELSACGHMFCASCLNRHRTVLLQTSSLSELCCPVCKEHFNYFGSARPCKRIEEQLHVLRVKCFYAGCSWTGKHEQLSRHYLETCLLTVGSCKSCGASPLKRQEFAKHKADQCPHRLVTCCSCQTSIRLCDQEKHKITECLAAFVDCPYQCCTAVEQKLLRKDLAQHKCPNQEIPCPYPGCSFQGRRDNMDKHTMDPNLLQQHLTAVCLHSNKLTQHVQKLQKQLLEIKMDIKNMASTHQGYYIFPTSAWQGRESGKLLRKDDLVEVRFPHGCASDECDEWQIAQILHIVPVEYVAQVRILPLHGPNKKNVERRVPLQDMRPMLSKSVGFQADKLWKEAPGFLPFLPFGVVDQQDCLHITIPFENGGWLCCGALERHSVCTGKYYHA